MDVHELTAAYALDALGAEERQAYEAHLAQCARCREELALLGGTAAELAWAVESPAPPPALRQRILDAAGAGRESVVPLRRRTVTVYRVAAAAAAAAAVALGVWAATLSSSLDSERSAHSAEAAAMAIYMDPASRKVPLHGRSGTLAVNPKGRGALVVMRLPEAPGDMTYEAWVIRPGADPRPAGMFGGGGSMTMVPLDESVPAGSVVALTLEQAGGADAPTRPPVVTAQA